MTQLFEVELLILTWVYPESSEKLNTWPDPSMGRFFRVCIFPTTLLRTGYDTRSIYEQSKAGLITEFSLF